MPSIIFNTNRKNLDIVAQGKYFPTFKEFASMVLTFSLTVFAWIFFRSDSVEHAMTIIAKLFSKSLFSIPHMADIGLKPNLIILLIVFLAIEWMGREEQFAIAKFGLKLPKTIRWGFYYAIVYAIFYFAGSEQQFIYFQF